MSALAARRAAAAAASSSSQSTPEPTVTVTRKPARQDQSLPQPRSQSNQPTPQSIPSPSAPSDNESSTDSPPSSSSKRRKLDSRISSPPTKQRYFAAQPGPSRSSNPSKTRAFSPSAPVIALGTDDEDDDGLDQGVDDSSAGESDLEEDDAEMIDAVDNERVRWDTAISAPSTPGPTSTEAGASRRDVGTSTFEVKEGVNMLRISSTLLKQAGVPTDGPGVLISLSQGENLMLAGIYTVTPLQQPLGLLSTILYPQSNTPYPVYAPTSHPIPVLEGIETATKVIKSSLLSKLNIPASFQLQDGKIPRTVFLLREHPSGLDGLRAGAVPGFSNVWLGESGPWGLCNVHPIVGSFPNPVYPYIVPASWSAALDTLNAESEAEESDLAAPVVLVKGPKRMGKSTLARAALNNLLAKYNQVAWLECDLGQGEFGCGGTVGLWVLDTPVFGPPFTHPCLPVKASYLGTYTPLACPDEYILAIRHILEVYKYEIQYPTTATLGAGGSASRRTDAVPLVINTQGWVKGLGEDLLRLIENASAPSHVFAFENPQPYLPPQGAEEEGMTFSPVYNPALLPPEHGGPIEPVKLSIVEPAPMSPLQTRYTSADMRILSLISYLHADLSSSLPRWDFSAPLAAVTPINTVVGREGPIREVYLIGEGAEGVVEEDMALALNGSIVALGRHDDTSSIGEVYIPARPLPSLEEMTVYGLALVRGVREGEEGLTIQLVTPLRAEVLSRVNCLVWNGTVELPLCGLLDWSRGNTGEAEKDKVWGVELDNVPFLARSVRGGVGVERKRVRRNLQRRNV